MCQNFAVLNINFKNGDDADDSVGDRGNMGNHSTVGNKDRQHLCESNSNFEINNCDSNKNQMYLPLPQT